jgi:hypothetical protein
MADRIRFGAGPEPGIIADLEDLREKREVDKIITRALEPDSNILILEEVLSCVKNSSLSPVSQKAILKALGPALGRTTVRPQKQQKRGATTPSCPDLGAIFEASPEPESRENSENDASPIDTELKLGRSRYLDRYLFVKDTLPGNGKAESLCSSPNGTLMAYITIAGVGIQSTGEPRSTAKRPVAQVQGSVASRSTSNLPRMINMVSMDPYEAWSIQLDQNLPDQVSGSLELAGISGTIVYIMQTAATLRRLYELDIHDGTLVRTHELGMPGGACFLDVAAQRLTFIDTSTDSLIVLDLVADSRLSFPLTLPMGLAAKDLVTMEFEPSGRLGVILVAPHADASGVLLGIARLPADTMGSEPGFAIRWLKRNDIWTDQGFEKVRFSPRRVSSVGIEDTGAFYLIDTTNTIHMLRILPLLTGDLQDVDSETLLEALPESKGGRKSLFPVMAVGSERPIMVTYDQITGCIRLWDTLSSCPIISIPCSFHVDRLELLAHDTLLVVKSRAMGRTWDTLTVTFLDFLFLVGQSPMTLKPEHLLLIDPLAAWAPDDQLLDFVRRLIKVNATNTKKEVA